LADYHYLFLLARWVAANDENILRAKAVSPAVVLIANAVEDGLVGLVRFAC
jgi:hypothetical protein